jgi:G3E family GTPase
MTAAEPALLMVVGGFLGAGKTTAILAAARHLSAAGRRVAIVTNDQASGLVDTAAARRAAPTVEIAGGCFCCRLPDLEDALARVADEIKPDVILAEAVGSCTDLAATVWQPLRQRGPAPLRLGPLSVVVDGLRLAALARQGQLPRLPAVVSYLFERQLAEADIILMNKIDLLAADERTRVEDHLAATCPGATALPISAASGTGLAAWLGHFADAPESGMRVLDLDYDRYAEAEACLGWLNLEGDLAGVADLRRWLDRFIRAAGELARADEIEIAHVKVWLETPTGSARAHLLAADQPPVTIVHGTPAGLARVIVNARVAASPERLRSLIDAAVAQASADDDARLVTTQVDAFSPARPAPTMRLTPLNREAGSTAQ